LLNVWHGQAKSVEGGQMARLFKARAGLPGIDDITANSKQ
jgi:hypothetical protein